MRNFEVLNGGTHVALTDKQLASLFGLKRLGYRSVKLLIKKPIRNDRRNKKPYMSEIKSPWWMFWRKRRYIIEMKELFYLVLMIDGLMVKCVTVDKAGSLQVNSAGDKINVHQLTPYQGQFEDYQAKHLIKQQQLDILEPDYITRIDRYYSETNHKWEMVKESSTYRSRN